MTDIERSIALIDKSNLRYSEELWWAYQTLKTAVLAQQTTNSAMVPCLRYASPGALCVASDQWKCKDKPCLLSAQHQ